MAIRRWRRGYGLDGDVRGAQLGEVIAYVRNRQPAVEIMELKILGKAQVLSSSEHL